MKKFCLIFIIFSLFVFTACGSSGSNEKSDPEEASADNDVDTDYSEQDTDSEKSDGDKESDDSEINDSESNDKSDADSGQPDDSGTGGDESATEVYCSELDGISGELTTCVNGECETDDCPGSNSCKNATECGECRNYEEECLEKDSGWGVYRCKVGTYSLVKECDQGCNESWDDCGTIECKDGTTKCVDGNDGRGETYTCGSGKWERDIDVDDYGNITEMKCTGSCNRKGTGCGESGCLNYTKECRDDLLLDSSHGGAIAECQFGKWEILSACTDATSCNKETGDCGECKNGNTKCENHEISGIMNKNCDYKGNCEKDSNGNVKYYPGTIGVQLLCYDGRWSDYNDLTKSSYCPAAEHTFQKYDGYKGYQDWSTEMTKVHRNGSAYYDDYHYSSCHNTGSVSKCGTCHNDFMACNDEDEGKPFGRIIKCDNGLLTYGNYCGNKTQICKDQYQCPQ